MREYRYDIVLETQIGGRNGQLVLKIEEEKIEGICTILGFSSPCGGNVDSLGNCTLTGQLRTFMSTYDYVGTGYVDSERVDLVLNSGKKQFGIKGTLVKQKKH